MFDGVKRLLPFCCASCEGSFAGFSGRCSRRQARHSCEKSEWNTKVDVCIIGGGIAGITAANLLAASGYTCVILEACGRLGGRLRALRFSDCVVEEGANWVQGLDGNPIWDLARKAGLNGTLEFNDSRGDSSVSIRVAGQELFSPEAESTFSAFDKAFERIEDSANEYCKDVDMETALRAHGWFAQTPVDFAVEYFRCDFEYGEVPAMTSVHHNVHEEFMKKDFGEGAFMVEDERGFAAMCPELAPSVACHLDAVVVEVERCDATSRLVVHVRDGRPAIEAKAVVSTVSIGVLNAGKILFNPPLPSWKVEALRSIEMCNYTKIFAEFETQFWDDERYILNASAIRGQYIVWQPLRGTRIVMITVTGDEGRRVELLSEEDLRSEIISALVEMYGDPPPRFTALHVCRWSSNPFFFVERIRSCPRARFLMASQIS